MPTYDHALNLRISAQLRSSLQERAERAEMTLNEYARLILTHAVGLSAELSFDLAKAQHADAAVTNAATKKERASDRASRK